MPGCEFGKPVLGCMCMVAWACCCGGMQAVRVGTSVGATEVEIVSDDMWNPVVFAGEACERGRRAGGVRGKGEGDQNGQGGPGKQASPDVREDYEWRIAKRLAKLALLEGRQDFGEEVREADDRSVGREHPGEAVCEVQLGRGHREPEHGFCRRGGSPNRGDSQIGLFGVKGEWVTSRLAMNREVWESSIFGDGHKPVGRALIVVV